MTHLLPQLRQMSTTNPKVVIPTLPMIYIGIMEAMIVNIINIMECQPLPGPILQPPDLNSTIPTLELITRLIIIVIRKEVLSFHPHLPDVVHLGKLTRRTTRKQAKIHPDIHNLVQKTYYFLFA